MSKVNVDSSSASPTQKTDTTTKSEVRDARLAFLAQKLPELKKAALAAKSEPKKYEAIHTEIRALQAEEGSLKFSKRASADGEKLGEFVQNAKNWLDSKMPSSDKVYDGFGDRFVSGNAKEDFKNIGITVAATQGEVALDTANAFGQAFLAVVDPETQKKGVNALGQGLSAITDPEKLKQAAEVIVRATEALVNDPKQTLESTAKVMGEAFDVLKDNLTKDAVALYHTDKVRFYSKAAAYVTNWDILTGIGKGTLRGIEKLAVNNVDDLASAGMKGTALGLAGKSSPAVSAAGQTVKITAQELAARSKAAIAKAASGTADDIAQNLDDVAKIWSAEIGNLAGKLGLKGNQVDDLVKNAERMGKEVLESYSSVYKAPVTAYKRGTTADISDTLVKLNNAVAEIAKKAAEQQLQSLQLPSLSEAIGRLNLLSPPQQRAFMETLIGKLANPASVLNPDESSLALGIAFARGGWGTSQASRAVVGQLIENGTAANVMPDVTVGVWNVAKKEIGRVDPLVRPAYNFYDDLIGEFTKKGTAVQEVMKDLSELGAKFQETGTVAAKSYAASTVTTSLGKASLTLDDTVPAIKTLIDPNEIRNAAPQLIEAFAQKDAHLRLAGSMPNEEDLRRAITKLRIGVDRYSLDETAAKSWGNAISAFENSLGQGKVGTVAVNIGNVAAQEVVAKFKTTRSFEEILTSIKNLTNPDEIRRLVPEAIGAFAKRNVAEGVMLAPKDIAPAIATLQYQVGRFAPSSTQPAWLDATSAALKELAQSQGLRVP